MSKLSDHVDWHYLLREFWNVYRFSSAGGSKLIRSYICLSGVISESSSGVYAPGSLLFNPPNQLHRMTTGDFEPTLLAYAWVGSQDKALGGRQSS